MRGCLYPEVIFPREDRIALVLSSYATDVVGQWNNPLLHGRTGGPVRVAVCVERRYPTPWTEREYSQGLSYFRALAKPWDPRGVLLDRSWPKVAVERFANGIVFNVELLRAAMEWKDPRLRLQEDSRWTFFIDCGSVPNTAGLGLVKLVAVSPAIKSPYGVLDEVRSCFGFFLAVEVVYPDGKTERHVDYFASYIVSRSPAQVYDGHGPPVARIPEAYWRADFGRWKSIASYVEEMPEEKRKWWYNTVFPWPLGY